MNFWNRLLGKAENPPESETQVSQHLPLYAKNHPASREISEVEAVVSETIRIKTTGDIRETSFTSHDYNHIKEILDRALEKCRDDADLVYARASLHYLFLQGEDGKNDRERCLRLDPDHFDAVMKRDHFKSWDTVFHLPRWDESQTELPEVMAKQLERDRTLQVARDHLRPAITVVIPASRVNLAGCSRLRWELRWESTPKGKVAAHYLFLDNGQFQEFFVPPLADGEPNPNSNYWLLQRLARENYCLIVITDGRSVVRNERFLFPASLRQTLVGMGADLLKSGPVISLQEFQRAAQWYMQNSDESSLKF